MPSRTTTRRTPAQPCAVVAVSALAALALASGCASLATEPFPEPLRPPKPAPAEERLVPEAAAMTVTPTPGVVIQRAVADQAAKSIGENLAGEPIQVSFNDLPLENFINEVFAEQLGLSFHIAPSLQGRADLVTLRLAEPLPPKDLFAAARAVLREYGVEIAEEAGILSFVAQSDFTGEVPLIISGRAQPEVPVTHRTVFQFVPLRVADPANIQTLLGTLFDRNVLRVVPQGDGRVLLRGAGNVVAQAVDLLDVLDQPLLRGRYGAILQPLTATADELAEDLEKALAAEGYAATTSLDGGGGAVVLLPLSGTNKLAAFAWDQATLDHVQEWARLLDAQQRDATADGVFSYEVLNTQAQSLSEALSSLLDEGQLIVDKNRNMLLFRGAGAEWGQLLPVVRQMDRPVPQVLIEVLIAEVTLGDDGGSGINFLFKSARDRFGLTGGTRTGNAANFRLETRALSLVLDRAGQTRAMLSAFFEESRAVIRQRPRLMVKSGGVATLEVGNEIPTITQTAAGNQNVVGPINTVQQVQYRQTGVNLAIEPIVQANGLVDLQATLTVSEARTTAAENRLTPTILRRTLTSSITLRDGGSLLMGGLISDNRSTGQTGVPGLAKLPGLGRLFRVDSRERDVTELVVMVIPYVVADHAEGRELTERVQAELTLHGGGRSAPRERQ